MPSLRIPKISIVTPSLNQGRFLQDCIESIRAQNWPDCEHIIIDGGSTDQTMDIIRKNERWLTSFVSEKDDGAADAINKGIARCRGDIIAWLNADDFYLPGAFQAVADAFSRDPGASFWFGNGIRVDERGVEKAVFNKNAIRYDRRALVEGLDYILQPAAFINRRVLDQVGLLDTSLRWSFDWDLWIRLGGHSQPAVIDTQLAASREWDETLTSNGGFRRAEELRRLAERHSGQAMTPGALCYWLDSISSFMAQSSATFGRGTSAAVFELWREVQKDMQSLNVDSSGNPSPDAAAASIAGDRNSFDRKPLTIGVDLYPLIAGVSGGIVPWVQGVLRELARLFPNDRILLFHRPGQPPLHVEGANVEYVPLDDHPVHFYGEMTRHCESIGVEAVIRTYPQEQHPSFPFTRQIFVIPDIQHEFFPEFFSKQVLAVRRRAFAYALSCGGAIATMTEHSRETMVSNSWTLTDDVFLMPAALPEELRETASDSDLPAAAAAFQQYFYMPANLWPHKNHRRLFEAFKLAFPHLPPNTGLVLSGNPEGLNDILKDFEDLPIIHLGFVPHRQVAALFSRAIALVYFSLFEGFGMPLLEAFHHGTPVLCSNATSLPEVGGDAALFCDPTDTQAMAELMQRITAEPGLREVLSEKARLRVLAYNWTKPAQELRGALDRVARNPVEYPERQPLVSIVMPTRNHAQFIRQSIDSVLSQSYANIELLVMDGASTDNTVEILKEYGDRIRWISEPDKGQADAINKGMELLRGDVLAYLNSDDILLPGAVARAVRYFGDHPECDMVYGNADYIDVNGVVTGSYTTAEYTFERLMHDCCVCQPAAFWRRRILERIGPFDASLQTAMDYEYWLRMATSGAIIHHTIEKLAQSRLHEEAKTLAMRGKIFEEVFAICERHGGYVSFSYFLGLWSYRFYEAWRGGSVLRRIAPRAYKLAALGHFFGQIMRIGMDRKKTAYVGRTLFGVVENRSPSIGKLIRRMWANSTTLRQRFR